MVGYAHNNTTIHKYMGKTPFENMSERPKLPLIVKYLCNVFATDEYVHDLKESFEKTKEAISIAK